MVGYHQLKPALKFLMTSNHYQPITAIERKVYEEFWKLANPEQAPNLNGIRAAAFFRQSMLDDKVLKAVWDLSTERSQSGIIVLSQFYTALRFISLLQSGLTASIGLLHCIGLLQFRLNYCDDVYIR